MVADRRSNIEMLRILSMMFVIMVHLDGAALGLPDAPGLSSLSAEDIYKLSLEALTIVGVNCFTLISGYFGIRARWRGFLRFTLQCMFYSVGIYLVFVALGLASWSWRELTESFMVYTHTDLWYVPAYLGLYLLSPFLNSAVSTLSRRQFALALAALVLFNLWGGWMWGGSYNPTGYTVMQLVMMYLIGRFLSLYASEFIEGSRRYRNYGLAVYLLSSVVITVSALFMESKMAYAYNNPIVILSSVALFVCFASMRFQSPTVNLLARTAFAAYLIHKNPYIWVQVIKPAALSVWHLDSLLLYTAFFLAFPLAVYMFSFVVDSLRGWLFRKI